MPEPHDIGPFESEDEARTLPVVRAIYEAYRAGKGRLDCAPLILAECNEAGIELGAYDRRIVAWLGNWEPQTCAVIAGLIHRAHERGTAAEGAVTEWALSYTHRPNVTSGMPARRVIQPYPDEAGARGAVADVRELAPEDEPWLMRREIGPWKEVPDAEVP